MNVKQSVIEHVGGLLENGSLPSFAWPGGYPIIYLDHDCQEVCAECATKSDWSYAEIIGAQVYWEGPTLQCANCNKDIESAYGDPDQDELPVNAEDAKTEADLLRERVKAGRLENPPRGIEPKVETGE